MPYIPSDARPLLDERINAIPAGLSAGELAYVVYRLLLRFTKAGGFASMAMAVGAIELTLTRFKDVVVMEHEDEKQAEHGDVTE